MGEVQNNIRDIRKYRGLSLKEAADYMGVPLSTYKKWEQGTNSPHMSTALRLSRFFGVTMDELFRPGEWDPSVLRDVGELDEEERRLIGYYRSFNEQGRRLIVRYGRDLLASRNYEPE